MLKRQDLRTKNDKCIARGKGIYTKNTCEKFNLKSSKSSGKITNAWKNLAPAFALQ